MVSTSGKYSVGGNLGLGVDLMQYCGVRKNVSSVFKFFLWTRTSDEEMKTSNAIQGKGQ